MTDTDTLRSRRITYYSHRIGKRIETKHFTADDGEQIIFESAHATLSSISQHPVRMLDDFNIHRAVDADGHEGFILKAARTHGDLTRTGSAIRGHGSDIQRVTTYCPTDEWAASAGFLYPTVEDAMVAGHSARALEQELALLDELTTRATDAAAQVQCDRATAWNRAAYEAACVAVDLEPADDATVRRMTGPGGGVYSIPEYHRDQVLWSTLAHHRGRGITDEQSRAEPSVLPQADRPVFVLDDRGYRTADGTHVGWGEPATVLEGVDDTEDGDAPYSVLDYLGDLAERDGISLREYLASQGQGPDADER